MSPNHITLTLASPDQTKQLAKTIGALLCPGDVLLLEGDIGAGKTHFSRSLIQSLLTVHEDVPSPTFTLVQVYETAIGEIWHADLYRLTTPGEVIELGLVDAFEDAICLVEWPDRLASLRPNSALQLKFTMAQAEDGRHLEISATDARWHPVFRAMAR